VTLTGPGTSRTVETVNGTGAAVISVPVTTGGKMEIPDEYFRASRNHLTSWGCDLCPEHLWRLCAFQAD
jgi:hypothetical protein